MAERTDALGIELSKDAFVFSNDPDGGTPMRPQSVTQKYRRLVRTLNIDTHLHALRNYSATELIAAGIDIRTVAGRLGHGGGGSTTLRVYAAWRSEADQRASQALTSRLPERPHVEPDPVERAKNAPEAPYERIAAEIRKAILSGRYQAGDAVPTVKDLQSEHGVSAGTANRAIGLLKTWGLVEVSRGRRATVLHPPEETPDDPTPAKEAEDHVEQTLGPRHTSLLPPLRRRGILICIKHPVPREPGLSASAHLVARVARIETLEMSNTSFARLQNGLDVTDS